MYQQYAEDVRANSALFICEVEGFDEERFLKPFAKVGDKLNKIVLTTWKFLDAIQKDKAKQDLFTRVVRCPEGIEPFMRVLSLQT